MGRQRKVRASDRKPKKETGRLAADLSHPGTPAGDPCNVPLLGGRCKYTVPADAGIGAGGSFTGDSATVFFVQCADDGTVYKRKTPCGILSDHIPSTAGRDQFHQYEKNRGNRKNHTPGFLEVGR